MKLYSPLWAAVLADGTIVQHRGRYALHHDRDSAAAIASGSKTGPYEIKQVQIQEPMIYTADEVAEMYGVSRARIMALRERRDVKGTQIGKGPSAPWIFTPAQAAALRPGKPGRPKGSIVRGGKLIVNPEATESARASADRPASGRTGP